MKRVASCRQRRSIELVRVGNHRISCQPCVSMCPAFRRLLAVLGYVDYGTTGGLALAPVPGQSVGYSNCSFLILPRESAITRDLLS